MLFKKNKVWLATDQNGTPVIKNGKVLIKYQLDQDYEYWVHENSVKPIDPCQQEKKEKTRTPPGKRESKIEFEIKHRNEKEHNDTVYIYTDGASSGNPGPSGIGVLFRFGKHEKEISKYIGIATNNIAELEAIRTGLLELKTTDLPVRIFTDSDYAYGVLIKGWKAKKNLNLIRSIKGTLSKFKDFKLIKVKGHAGIEGNERADYLATLAIKTENEKSASKGNGEAV